MSSQLFQELSSADSLPTPPGVALEIIRLNKLDNLEIDQLTEVVKRDPAIAAKLIKMANSSSFGRPGQVTEISQVIMTLGLRSVNLLALSFSLAGSATGQAKRFDYERFWTCAAVTTTASGLLCDEHCPELSGEAFLAALLCDFAQLALAECAPRHYAPVLRARKSDRRPIHEVENDLIGCSHASLGAELLRSWGLPESVCSAVGSHHDSGSDDAADSPKPRLSQVLELASLCGALYSEDETEPVAEAILASATRHFGMTNEDCQAFLGKVEQQVPELIDVLQLQTTDANRLAEIRLQATEHLVRESLALNQQMQAVSNDAERLQRENSELEERAITDPLTSLKNRGFFDEFLESEVARAAQTQGSLGLLMIDIDHFKSVNDDHGHTAGDRFLVAIGKLLQRHCGPDDCAARYGGEELVLILPGVSLEELAARAESLREEVEGMTIVAGESEIRRTISLGGCLVATASEGLPASEIIEAADSELYRAKSEGRNRARVRRLGS